MAEGSIGAGNGRTAVLIVDDDVRLLQLLKNIFRVAQYDVVVAHNGGEALDVTRHQRIDVIVMDLRMPEVDGPTFFRQLRAGGDQTPVLVASSHGARSAQRELGAEGAIEKPFDPDELLEAVDSLLRSKRPV